MNRALLLLTVLTSPALAMDKKVPPLLFAGLSQGASSSTASPLSASPQRRIDLRRSGSNPNSVRGSGSSSPSTCTPQFWWEGNEKYQTLDQDIKELFPGASLEPKIVREGILKLFPLTTDDSERQQVLDDLKGLESAERISLMKLIAVTYGRRLYLDLVEALNRASQFTKKADLDFSATFETILSLPYFEDADNLALVIDALRSLKTNVQEEELASLMSYVDEVFSGEQLKTYYMVFAIRLLKRDLSVIAAKSIISVVARFPQSAISDGGHVAWHKRLKMVFSVAKSEQICTDLLCELSNFSGDDLLTRVKQLSDEVKSRSRKKYR